jgi:hydroxymethylpyrimidine/phosphomethylpyrimidine kinase
MRFHMHTYTHVHIHIDKHHERLQQAKNKTIYVLMKTPPQKNKINRPERPKRSFMDQRKRAIETIALHKQVLRQLEGQGLEAVLAATKLLTACLAGGADVETAVKEAQDYTWQTLANAFRPGMGQFIPDRMYWAHGDDAEV